VTVSATWHHALVNPIAARYDRAADRYDRWWAPVIAPMAALTLPPLDELVATTRGARLLDVGTGSGTLLLAALQRWPEAHLVGTDASGGMLAAARGRIANELPGAAGRFRLEHAEADRQPLADGSIDAVISSFVFQLVPDRPAALREMRRVLRPGGRLSIMTWLGETSDFAPDDALDDALDELGVDVPDEPEEPRSGNFSSAPAAAAQVRRAGFRRVRAEPLQLAHRYGRSSYLDFLEQYGERELFEALSPKVRREVRRVTANLLAAIPEEGWTWRAAVVLITATA